VPSSKCAPYILLEIYRRFGGAYCLPLQGRRVHWTNKKSANNKNAACLLCLHRILRLYATPACLKLIPDYTASHPKKAVLFRVRGHHGNWQPQFPRIVICLSWTYVTEWSSAIALPFPLVTLVSFNLSFNTYELYLYGQRYYFMHKVASWQQRVESITENVDRLEHLFDNRCRYRDTFLGGQGGGGEDSPLAIARYRESKEAWEILFAVNDKVKQIKLRVPTLNTEKNVTLDIKYEYINDTKRCSVIKLLVAGKVISEVITVVPPENGYIFVLKSLIRNRRYWKPRRPRYSGWWNRIQMGDNGCMTEEVGSNCRSRQKRQQQSSW
jgi:hypothetical protein